MTRIWDFLLWLGLYLSVERAGRKSTRSRFLEERARPGLVITQIAYSLERMTRKPIPRPNPFVFARALAPEEGIERPDEVRFLLARATGGHHVAVFAPRRMGKTSLLKQLRVAAEREGISSLLVDLSDVLSVADVAVRLEQGYRALPGRVGRLMSRELGGLTALGFSIQRRGETPDPLATLHSLLDVPARVAAKTNGRGLVIFDEFQALIDLKGLDGVFRSHLQHHESVSYVFCGSEPSLLRALFEDRARPLFGQAEQMRLGRLPYGPAHDFIARRFNESGRDAASVAPELVRLSELHPQRLMLIAHHLWEQLTERPASMSDLRRAHDSAMRAVDTELRYQWDGLSANERRVVAAVASGLSPYQAEARALSGLATASSAQRAVESLLGRAILEREPDAPPQIVDPLFGRWVRRHGGARPGVYVLPAPDGKFIVTDGPSLAFLRSEHETLEDAEAEADRVVKASGRSADVMIYDSDDPNDLPDWAIRSG
jgi:uncharacterized protein